MGTLSISQQKPSYKGLVGLHGHIKTDMSKKSTFALYSIWNIIQYIDIAHEFEKLFCCRKFKPKETFTFWLIENEMVVSSVNWRKLICVFNVVLEAGKPLRLTNARNGAK